MKAQFGYRLTKKCPEDIFFACEIGGATLEKIRHVAASSPLRGLIAKAGALEVSRSGFLHSEWRVFSSSALAFPKLRKASKGRGE